MGVDPATPYNGCHGPLSDMDRRRGAVLFIPADADVYPVWASFTARSGDPSRYQGRDRRSPNVHWLCLVRDR